MRRLKICHVLFGMGIGGIETLLVKLVNRMDATRFEHFVLCLTGEDDLDGQLTPGIAPILHLDRREGNDLSMIPRVTTVLRSIRPDVVHTRNWSTFLEGVIPSLLARVPGRVHSFDGLNADMLEAEPRRRIYAQRLLLPTVKCLVARSEAMRDTLCSQLKLDRASVQLIADGIDLERFDGPLDRPAVRARWGLTPEDCVVGIVARLDPVKDHATLLRAMALAVPRAPNLKLMVVGGGPLETEIRAQAAASPVSKHLLFTGPQLEVPALYRAMDLYAQPSLYEGVSGAILEAMAARLPVLSTPVGGTVDILREGETGFLSPVGDEAALAAHLVRLASNHTERQRLGAAGRAFVTRHFNLGQVLDKYGRVYEEACGWRPVAGSPGIRTEGIEACV